MNYAMTEILTIRCFPTQTTNKYFPTKSNALTITVCHSKWYNNAKQTRMWANAQRDGRPAEHRWRPLFNTASLADAHY